MDQSDIVTELKSILVFITQIILYPVLRVCYAEHESKEVEKDDLGEEGTGFPRGIIDTRDEEPIKPSGATLEGWFGLVICD